MGADMGEMMKQMGAPPPKELYPSLMALPDEVTPEQRAGIEQLAHERMKTGTALLSSGLEKLSDSTSDEDYAAMQQATAQMREGLAEFEAGLAARRLLSEGKAPRNLALDWFKREMNLASPVRPDEPRGLLGVTAASPLHDGAAHCVRARHGRHVLLQDAPRGGPLRASRSRHEPAAARRGTAACRSTDATAAPQAEKSPVPDPAGRKSSGACRADLARRAGDRNTSGRSHAARRTPPSPFRVEMPQMPDKPPAPPVAGGSPAAPGTPPAVSECDLSVAYDGELARAASRGEHRHGDAKREDVSPGVFVRRWFPSFHVRARSVPQRRVLDWRRENEPLVLHLVLPDAARLRRADRSA